MNWDALQDVILSTLNHVSTQQPLALELVAIIFRLVERRIKLLFEYLTVSDFIFDGLILKSAVKKTIHSEAESVLPIFANASS